MPFELNTLIRDMPNSEYHGVGDTFSSSQLKDALDDPEVFYKKYISKEIERQSIPAFDVGTYFHTAVLEPHKLEEDCAVFEGVRRGKAWEKFKEDNADKAIITKAEHKTALNIVEAAKTSEIAMDFITRGEAEVSAFIEIFVDGNDIFAGDKVLGENGWHPTLLKPSEEAVRLVIKCRADCLGDTYILDLKSTTGNAKSKHKIKSTVSNYSYDLSAAFYLDVFTIASGRELNSFIWTFASKDVGNCKSWVADKDTIQIGRAKWKKAIVTIAYYQKHGWEFQDSLDMIEPNFYEREWLENKEEDLL